MDLGNIIAERLRKSGPMPFQEFMDLALYHPSLGYYSKRSTVIGKGGDFYTSPYLSKAFGAMIGRQMEEMCRLMNTDFTIVEFGGRSGILCLDVMDYLKTTTVYERIRYVLIDKNNFTRIPYSLHQHRIHCYDHIKQLGKFRGCIFSNELFDNFPIRRLAMSKDGLLELYVRFENGFEESWEKASPAVAEFAANTGFSFLPGEVYELSEQAGEWFSTTVPYLEEGFVLTIDYGYLAHEFKTRNKNQGTLRCYYRHQRHFDPYLHIGKQDITADVNFSHLARLGSACGLKVSGYVNQAHFLRALGFVSYLSSMEQCERDKIFAAEMLLRETGAQFKILIQQKGIAVRPLQGLLFQSPLNKHNLAPA